MKKVFALILCLCLLASTALAAGSDLSAMTDSELQTLQQLVWTEIKARGLKDAIDVPQGSYIVGEDIPAGSYSLHSTGRYASIRVYPSVDAPSYDNYSHKVDTDLTVGKITLNDGEKVEIKHAAIRFVHYTGLFN